jgi:hypothetical protein
MSEAATPSDSGETAVVAARPGIPQEVDSMDTLLERVATGFPGEVDGDYVDFYVGGTVAKGEFRCADCGYGVVVSRELPRCPMCSEQVWERVDWRPFSHLVD